MVPIGLTMEIVGKSDEAVLLLEDRRPRDQIIPIGVTMDTL